MSLPRRKTVESWKVIRIQLSRTRLLSRHTVTPYQIAWRRAPDGFNHRECPALRGRCPGERLLYDFAVQCEVETVALRVLCHAQADKHLDHAEDDQAGDGIIDEDDGDPDALIEELTDISLQNARRSAVLLDREHPGQQCSDDAANRVHAEAIQRIVIAEHVLQAGASPVTDDARGNSDCKGTDGSDEAGSR